MKRIVFASGNRHKVAEIGAMLAPHGFAVEPLVAAQRRAIAEARA